MAPCGGVSAVMVIALGLTVSACDSQSTPERHPDPPAQISLVDMGFVEDMVVHHKQMIGYADALAADGSTVGVRRIAEEIAAQERAELETLAGLYEGWTGEEDEAAEGGQPTTRPTTPGDLSTAREIRLLRHMIELHFDGLLAARHEAAVGINPAAKLTAKRIEDRIRAETAALKRALHEVRAR